jgi:hypothetical protein
MRIFFDPNTLHQGQSGSITGVVYFDFSPGQEFPSKGWNDFVVVLASWWIQSLTEISNGTSEVKLRFMDGPFWITAVPNRENLILRCIEDGRDVVVKCEVEVDLDELTAEIFSFAQRVSVACEAAGMRSTDLDTMRAGLPN